MPKRMYEYREDKGVYECDMCGMQFEDEAEVEEHLQKDHGEGY